MASAVRRRTLAMGALATTTGLAALFVACSDSYRPIHPAAGGAPPSSTTGGGGSTLTLTFDDSGPCPITCSNDLKSVVDCKGRVQGTCTVDQGCADGACIADPCKAAEQSKSSYGCDYWAIKTAQRPQADGACFAAFLANTWGKPLHILVEYGGQTLPVASFTGIPVGQGQALTYRPYDPAAGLGVGEVAILFLSRKSFGGSTVVNCPIPAALNEETGVVGTGIGKGFHITTDYPVVAYQMVPYGGAQAYVTSATLLLPTSAWDTNYLAIGAYPSSDPHIAGGNPSIDILAHVDNTVVTLLPKVDIAGGPEVLSAVAGQPVTYTLNAGEFLQVTQPAELTGSPILASQPVGVFGASACMDVPLGQDDCDSGQQQIPPLRALGSEYVAVRYRGRGGKNEAPPWRLVGAVDGTELHYDPSAPPSAPTSLALGETAEFNAAGPFVVRSQDIDHPFYLGGYMTGGAPFSGEGDPDWVNVISPSQYLNHYVLFTDPTYPETNLVLVRTPSKVDGTFADVTLTCAGGVTKILTAWQPIGSYEYTRVDLVTGNFTSVDGCSNGRQEVQSALPFSVTVWGWGNTQQTQYVSYAYPAGAGFQPINHISVPPVPR